MLQQQGAVAFLVQGGRRAHRAGQEPHHPIDDRGRRQFAAGEHEITDRHLLVGQGANPFVEALVVAAEKHQLVVVRRPSAQVGLNEGLALGAHQQHPPPRQHGDGPEGGIHRFGFEHHARATAVGLVVDLAVLVGGVIAGIVGVELGDASAKGPADHPQPQQGRKGLRGQAHHIESHGSWGRIGFRPCSPAGSRS